MSRPRAATLALLLAATACDRAPGAPATEPPPTAAPRTEPPRTEPPRTEPPRTEPPRTEPPRTEPPRTEPPPAALAPWLDRFQADRGAFYAELRAADPPTAQWVVRGLGERLAPDDLAALRDGLDPERQAALVRTVDVLLSRPHLRAPTRAPPAGAGLPAPWRIGFAPGQRWLRGAAPGTSDAVEAQTEAAVQAARAGELEALAAACDALAVPRYRADCYFQAAERSATLRGEALARSVLLCADAGLDTASTACLAHVAEAAAAPLPPMSRTTAATWAEAGRAIEEAVAAARALQAEGLEDLDALLWSVLVQAAVGRDEALVVDLALLPPPARPHARASLAEAWLHGRRAPAGELEALVAELAALEADPSSQRGLAKPVFDSVRAWHHGKRWELWTEVLPEERALPRLVHCGHGAAIRTTAPEDAIDRAIVILEVGARAEGWGGREALLRSGTTHPDARVRWTAVRLLATLGAPPALAEDPDPLVAARLAWGR